MDGGSILAWIIVGGVAGWLAGLLMQGGGFGIIGDIVIGIVGAVVAGWILPALGLNIGVGNVYATAIINAVIGAVILLLIIRLVRRAI